jgi:multidrug resistance efflux pump
MNSPASKTPSPVSPNRTRRLSLLALGAVVILSGFGYAGYWFLDGRYFESTDDGARIERR